MAKAPKVKMVDADDDSAPMKLKKQVNVAAAPEEVVEEVVVEEPVAVKAAPAPAVEEVKMNPGWVRFVSLKDVEPAPIVGKFSFLHDLGIDKLKENTSYNVPKNVAMHLVDRKVGIIA